MVTDAVSAPDAAFLGVARSLGGRTWRLRPSDERLARALVQRHALPEPVARILAGRGVGPDQADDHLNPSLRTGLPDPSHKASARDLAGIERVTLGRYPLRGVDAGARQA